LETLTVLATDLASGAARSEAADLTAPVLFLARGHSGTTILARLLEIGGVFMGDAADPKSLNQTYDSLIWAHGFERYLVPRLFEWGRGCRFERPAVHAAAGRCLERHLAGDRKGPWGFKTCGAMFCLSLYREVFPNAKYIYLVRDGRDVTISGGGILYLTNPISRERDWEYFKVITFGLSNDVHTCPFEFPAAPSPDDVVMRNKYWIQAKCWREHVRMMERLAQEGELTIPLFTLRYEDLCTDPVGSLEAMFAFLELPLAPEVCQAATTMVHANSVGRWKYYRQHVGDCGEDMEAVFASMGPELKRLGYPA